MYYATIEEGRASSGLRLVLSAGVAAPWSESAKAIFACKGQQYLAVAQDPGGENLELAEWTGQSAAPVAICDDDRPYTDSLDILFLAERLAPEPRLIPADAGERILALGLSREIIGRLGLGWNRRLMIQAANARTGMLTERQQRLMTRHDFQTADAELAESRIAATFRHMADLLRAQQQRGSRYFVGQKLSCADLYWAVFSIMFKPLPRDDCPMEEEKRMRFADLSPVLTAALDPTLIDHRDHVFANHIGLPMDFLISNGGEG